MGVSAAQGAVVHLVRDGQAVADIVPAASAPATNERALAIERRQSRALRRVDAGGLPQGL